MGGNGCTDLLVGAVDRRQLMTIGYRIDKGVPIPKSKQKGSGRNTIYPFGRMQVGDSFFVPLTKATPRINTPRGMVGHLSSRFELSRAVVGAGAFQLMGTMKLSILLRRGCRPMARIIFVTIAEGNGCQALILGVLSVRLRGCMTLS